jgi:hypothetical protein
MRLLAVRRALSDWYMAVKKKKKEIEAQKKLASSYNAIMMLSLSQGHLSLCHMRPYYLYRPHLMLWYSSTHLSSPSSISS